jgi:hypothetical protein
MRSLVRKKSHYERFEIGAYCNGRKMRMASPLN